MLVPPKGLARDARRTNRPARRGVGEFLPGLAGVLQCRGTRDDRSDVHAGEHDGHPPALQAPGVTRRFAARAGGRRQSRHGLSADGSVSVLGRVAGRLGLVTTTGMTGTGQGAARRVVQTVKPQPFIHDVRGKLRRASPRTPWHPDPTGWCSPARGTGGRRCPLRRSRPSSLVFRAMVPVGRAEARVSR